MEHNDPFTEQESLGALFRKLRLERSLDISDVADETKIPPNTIRAIEADDFDSLPAHAFAKGFYNLYAKMLGLDQEEVLRRYLKERGLPAVDQSQDQVGTPSWQRRQVGSLAERPTSSAGSMIGVTILIIILAAAGICWYIGYNPAPGISKWLRGLQESPPSLSTPEQERIDIQFKPAEETGPVKSSLPEAAAPAPPRQEAEQSGGTVHAPAVEADIVQTDSKPTQYLLVAEFTQNTTATVTIDKDEPVTQRFTAGSVTRWQAAKSITLKTEPGSLGTLTLNDISIPVPEPVDDHITISIPEYLLDADVNNQN